MKDQKAIEWLSGQLPGLVAAGVLTPESAEALRIHYEKAQDPGRTHNLAVIVCAILGGTLIGAGIILLLAHNWEDIGRPMRTVLSFLPLLAACVISGRAILRKPASTALNEGGGIFHVLSIGAAISLVSQTYHISGDFAGFVLVWSLLALPLVYLLHSTSVAMLYITGITVWAGYSVDHHAEMLWFWPLFIAVMPFYVMLLREDRFSNRANWLSTAVAVALPVAMGLQSDSIFNQTWYLTFVGLGVVFYLVEREWLRKQWSWKFVHPFRFVGAGGIAVLAIIMSFRGVVHGHYYFDFSTPGHCVALVTSYGLVVAAVGLLFFCWRNKTDFNVVAALFPAAASAAYVLSVEEDTETVFIVMNCYAAALALGTIVRGFRHDRLATLNSGMIIASALIIVRFFDSDISFVARGVTFIVIGTGFLAANWLLLRKRKEQKQ